MGFDELNELLLSPTAIVALIIGIAEILKKIGLPAKYIPIIDVMLGIAAGICVYGLMLNHDLANGALIGLAMGLSACGLFSGVKNVVEGFKHDAEG